MRISSAVSMRVGAMAALFIIVTGTAAGQYFRGVNVSQAEWGDPLNETYGIGNYTYATAPTFNYFAARGLPFIRLVVKWERLQPTLAGDLDSPNLGIYSPELCPIRWRSDLQSQVCNVPRSHRHAQRWHGQEYGHQGRLRSGHQGVDGGSGV